VPLIQEGLTFWASIYKVPKSSSGEAVCPDEQTCKDRDLGMPLVLTSEQEAATNHLSQLAIKPGIEPLPNLP
jgi:hypothetical protein